MTDPYANPYEDCGVCKRPIQAAKDMRHIIVLKENNNTAVVITCPVCQIKKEPPILEDKNNPFKCSICDIGMSKDKFMLRVSKLKNKPLICMHCHRAKGPDHD